MLPPIFVGRWVKKRRVFSVVSGASLGSPIIKCVSVDSPSVSAV